MTEVLPFSSAAERNAEPIAQKLTELLAEEPARILEIGSGTGQHVAFFAERFPEWTFQPSDRNNEYFDAVRQRISNLENVSSPLVLDLLNPPPMEPDSFDYIIAINVFQVAPSKWSRLSTSLGSRALNRAVRL